MLTGDDISELETALDHISTGLILMQARINYSMVLITKVQAKIEAQRKERDAADIESREP